MTGKAGCREGAGSRATRVGRARVGRVPGGSRPRCSGCGAGLGYGAGPRRRRADRPDAARRGDVRRPARCARCRAGRAGSRVGCRSAPRRATSCCWAGSCCSRSPPCVAEGSSGPWSDTSWTAPLVRGFRDSVWVVVATTVDGRVVAVLVVDALSCCDGPVLASSWSTVVGWGGPQVRRHSTGRSTMLPIQVALLGVAAAGLRD